MLSAKIAEELILELAASSVLAFSIALLWKHNIVLTGIYLSIFLAAARFWKNKSDIVLFIFAAVFFHTGEIIIANMGAWTYNNPTYLGIPIWLPLSWGYTAVIISRLSNTLSKLFA